MRLSALGDVLHALPVLSGLRDRFPEARIDWVVEDRHADLLHARTDLDRVIVYPRRDISSALRGLPRPLRALHSTRAFLRDLRTIRYDALLDLQGNLKSGAVSRAARAGVRMGYDRRAAREANQLFTTRRWLPLSSQVHRVERGLGLASALVGAPLPYLAPGFPVSAEDAATARALRARAGAEGRRYVVLHPGTSGFGRFKRWPADRFAAVATRLAGTGLTVLVTYGPGERALAEGIATRAELPGVVPVGPPNLGSLAALIDGAAGFLGADTGPLHLAGLVGTPLLGLFGPKDPAVYGPYGQRSEGTPGLLPTRVRDDVACRPCSRRRCADPLCMRTLAPEQVYADFQRVLASAGSA